MRQKTLVIICGAAIVASLFLPWTGLAGAPSIVPWEQVKGTDWAKLAEKPPLFLSYLATFALAALITLLAVIGWAPRFLALVTSLIAVGLVGYVWLEAAEVLPGLGITPPVGDSLSAAYDWVIEAASIGFYLWSGGAALLLLVALLDGGDRY